jgi:hypothetical protein
LVWATGDALKKNLDWLTEWVLSLDTADAQRVRNVIQHAGRMTQPRRSGLLEGQLKSLSPRLVLFMDPLLPSAEREQLLSQRVLNYRGSDPMVLQYRADIMARQSRDVNEWRAAARAVARAYAGGLYWGPQSVIRAPAPAVARTVVARHDDYPLRFVEAAEIALDPPSHELARIEDIARVDRWFVDWPSR